MSLLKNNLVIAKALQRINGKELADNERQDEYTEWNDHTHWTDSYGHHLFNGGKCEYSETAQKVWHDHVHWDAHTHIESNTIPAKLSINSGPFTWVIVSPVSTSCNLGCVYCYHGSANKQNQQSLIVMTKERLESIIYEFINNFHHISFIWHGGEPLLAGIDFYTEAIYFQNKYKRKGQIIENLIQTNGTLLNDTWTNFLKDNNFKIGLSLDGPTEIHNDQRPLANGQPSFQDVMSSIDILKRNDVRFGVLAVVTKQSLKEPQGIYRFITNITNSFDFLPYGGYDSPANNFDYALKPLDFGFFMKEIFDLWMADNNPDIYIRTLGNILESMIGGKPTICKLSGNCERYISIDSNGDVYPCNRFSQFKEYKLGNLLEMNLKQVYNTQEMLSFVKQIKESRSSCSKCNWYKNCHGDCTHHRHSLHGITQKSYFCSSYKMLFEHVNEYIHYYYDSRKTEPGTLYG